MLVRTPHQTMLRNAVGDGDLDLDPGDHPLTLKAVNAEGTGTTSPIGIDFVWLVKR